MPMPHTSALKTLPGSYASVTTRRFMSSVRAEDRSVGSYVGLEQAARISPVVGSVTMTEP